MTEETTDHATDITEELFTELNQDYNSIKLYIRKVKFESVTEPEAIASGEEARSIASAALCTLQKNISSIDAENRFYYRFIGMRSALMCEQAKLFTSDDHITAQELLMTALDHLLGGALKPELTFVLLRVINQYSYFLSLYEEYDQAQLLLEQGEKIYDLLKENDNTQLIFFTADDLFMPSLELVPRPETYEHMERLVTNNLQMLGFVYDKQEHDELFAAYQHRVLDRQLRMREGEALGWAVKATRLGNHFANKNQFREARTHLSAACKILNVYEEDLMAMPVDEQVVAKFEEVSVSGADIGRAWIKYGLQLMAASTLHLADDFNEAGGGPENSDEEGTAGDSDEDGGNEGNAAMGTAEAEDNVSTGAGEGDIDAGEKAVENKDLGEGDRDNGISVKEAERDEEEKEEDAAEEKDKSEKDARVTEVEGKGSDAAESGTVEKGAGNEDEVADKSDEVKDLIKDKATDPKEGDETAGNSSSADDGTDGLAMGSKEVAKATVESFEEGGNVDGPTGRPSANAFRAFFFEDCSPEHALSFPCLDLAHYERVVPCEPVTSLHDARQLFAFVDGWHARTIRHYTMHEHPYDYAESTLDMVEMLRFMTFYEHDTEAKYTVHAKRAETLDMICDAMRATHPECFAEISYNFYRELADAHMELMGLNLSRLYAAAGEEEGEEEEEEEGEEEVEAEGLDLPYMEWYERGEGGCEGEEVAEGVFVQREATELECLESEEPEIVVQVNLEEGEKGEIVASVGEGGCGSGKVAEGVFVQREAKEPECLESEEPEIVVEVNLEEGEKGKIATSVGEGVG